MNPNVPPRTLDSLKKEAKRWCKALRAGDPGARARLEKVLPDAPARPTLRHVQLGLAREHGYPGWAALRQAVEASLASNRGDGPRMLAHYEAAAEALLDAYRSGAPDAMERHYSYTWHRRAWRAMRTYVQLDLGKRPAHPGDEVEITLDDARHLVAVEYGFANWSELEAFTRSPRVARHVIPKPMRLVAYRGPLDLDAARGWPDEWEPVASSRDWDEIVELLRQPADLESRPASDRPSAGLSAEGQMTDELLADLPRAETLFALGLGGCRAVTDEGVRHLARLPALQHLDLSGTRITDDGLQVLRHLPHLRSLSLAWTRITTRGMAALSHCDELEQVNLCVIPGWFESWPARAGDAAIRALAGKRKLHRLEIALSDAGLPLLHELPVFRTWQGGGAAPFALLGQDVRPNHLSLRGPFTDRGMHQLRGLGGLFSLDIDDPRLWITPAGLEPLVALANLAALSVDAKDDWMRQIAEMPRLRYLGIQDTSGDDGFVALSRSRSIEQIWGRRCHNLRSRGFVALSEMPALRGLSVSCLNVDDAGIAALPAFPALRELMPMDVPDAGYRHIGRCERLESLVLMYCRDTTDAATEHITGLGHLTYYFNSYTTITDRTPELLSTMDSLERITFDTCHGLTNAGVVRLARLPRLRELRVSGHGITADVRNAFPPPVRVLCG
jgi:hypothetical protein